MKQIQSEADDGAQPANGTASADTEIAEDEENEAAEEADEEDAELSDDEELGSISSGEDSDEDEVDEEEAADGEEGAGARAAGAGTVEPMEASSRGAQGVAGKSPLLAISVKGLSAASPVCVCSRCGISKVRNWALSASQTVVHSLRPVLHTHCCSCGHILSSVQVW